ncbi:MAG TPA: PKD domain-containing protein [Bryobacteraceae bacterium]|nr:PKD domain-containing protein [Bryobacteraceae bacterium]
MRAVSRFAVLALVVAGIFGSPHAAYAQNAARTSNDYFNFIEANVFGGVGYYAPVDAGLGTRFTTDGLVGVRLTENFWEHFGLEESYTAYSSHNLLFSHGPTANATLPPLDIHVHEVGVNFLAYLTSRESTLRPFLTIGVGGAFWDPSRHARRLAGAEPPSLGLTPFNSFNGAQGTYGAGIKWQVHPRIGVRADLRASLGRNPNFNLANAPNASGSNYYIPNNRFIQGLETTIGLSFYFGRRGEKPAPPAPPPPPPPPPPPQHALNAGNISASSTSVCPGDAVTLNSNASDPQGHRLNYQWSVNGSNQGGNSSSYTYTPSNSGDYRVGVRVSDTATENAAGAVDATPVSIHVRQYARPTVSGVTADPSNLDRGQTAALRANATGSECSGTLTYSWAATEGTVTGTGPTAQYNSGSVSFNEGDRSRPQSKQVTVTATVTDSRGGSASASANLNVNFAAQARHFGDILFPKDSARVNNCGKRVLIEQLYPELTANTNYDVVLVGHIDSSEVPRARSSRNRNLDRSRVLQTAAVLSAGGGTCTSLDRSRIRGSWVGATQETESVPASCTVSTTAPRERRGATVNTDEAKNRRVEIWLVPRGMPLPAAARDASELPNAELTRIGCPK